MPENPGTRHSLVRATAESRARSTIADKKSYFGRGGERADGINSPGFEVLERMADRLGLPVRELFDFRKPARAAGR